MTRFDVIKEAQSSVRLDKGDVRTRSMEDVPTKNLSETHPTLWKSIPKHTREDVREHLSSHFAPSWIQSCTVDVAEHETLLGQARTYASQRNKEALEAEAKCNERYSTGWAIGQAAYAASVREAIDEFEARTDSGWWQEFREYLGLDEEEGDGHDSICEGSMCYCKNRRKEEKK